MTRRIRRAAWALCGLLWAAVLHAGPAVRFQPDSLRGTLRSIRLEGDPMAWLLRTDGSQYPWVGESYAWGGGYLTADGTVFPWTWQDGRFTAGPVEIAVTRSEQEGDLVESYVFTNVSDRAVSLSDIGIYTPFNDNYPAADTCMTGRCHAHIWPGGTGAWVQAVKMSGRGPGLGLVVTRGAIADYEIWERGNDKGWSNDRGVIALCPPSMTLEAGASWQLSWRVFGYEEGDFPAEMLRRGGTWTACPKYVYREGEMAEVRFRKGGRETVLRQRLRGYGEHRIGWDGAWAEVWVTPQPDSLIARRIGFILDHQQMNDPEDPRYGAYMVYDRESGALVTDDQGRSDEGRERVGMGILLAEWCRRHPSQRLRESLERYARFLRQALQEEDYSTTSSVFHPVPDRGYNYPWIADFYFRMYALTGERQYVLDGYGTLKALMRRFGHGFYCIDYPVLRGLAALREAGLEAERADLLADFRQTAEIFRSNGLSFPSHEVNYEQSIVAPAVLFLSEMAIAENDPVCLEAACAMLPALGAFAGEQPSHRMHGIAIRHWDVFWFGKRPLYGDTFPHYWSTITAVAYARFAQALQALGAGCPDARELTRTQGSYPDAQELTDRALAIVQANLSLFAPDGNATCAYLRPRRVDGHPGRYSDPYANDQDWALVAWLALHE